MARASKPKGLAEGTAAFLNDSEPVRVSVVVTSNGRILLPAEVRSALGVAEGGKLHGSVQDGQLTLMTSATALRKTQQRLKGLVPPGVSLVDELIAERRAENAREEAEVRAYLEAKKQQK